MNTYYKIQILLRLAQMCTPLEHDRRQAYMDEVDHLMTAEEKSSGFNDIFAAFDFNAPKSEWRWILSSDLKAMNVIEFSECYTNIGFGRLLSRHITPECGIIKKHISTGSYYLMPPLQNNRKGAADEKSIN